MNNYPEWWDTDLTIYNKFEDPQTRLVTWYKTIVKDAFWKYTGDKITINKTTLETNNTICRIRKDSKFLESHIWKNTPNDKMSKYFTLSPGDIIVKGAVTDEIDEYISGKRSNDLEKKYKNLQGCIRVEEVAINVGAGRCDEHYYVRGV